MDNQGYYEQFSKLKARVNRREQNSAIKVKKMLKSLSGKNLLKRNHWSTRAHETLISRNKEGHFCLSVEGGAEVGLIPYIGDLRQDRITYRSGRLQAGELVLEVNHKRVPGMIKKDVIALIKHSSDPVSLVTVKQSESLL